LPALQGTTETENIAKEEEEVKKNKLFRRNGLVSNSWTAWHGMAVLESVVGKIRDCIGCKF